MISNCAASVNKCTILNLSRTSAQKKNKFIWISVPLKLVLLRVTMGSEASAMLLLTRWRKSLVCSAVKKYIVCWYFCETTWGKSQFKSEYHLLRTFHIQASNTSEYMSSCCVCLNSDAWDSSVHRVRHQSTPSWRVPWGTRWARGVGASSSPLQPSRLQTRGKWVKWHAVVSVSTDNRLPSWVTVWPRCSSGSALYSRSRPFSRFWVLWLPAFVCIAVRRAELTLVMSSHPCAVSAGACTALSLSLFHARSTGLKYLIFNPKFLFRVLMLHNYLNQLTHMWPVWSEKQKCSYGIVTHLTWHITFHKNNTIYFNLPNMSILLT